MLKAIWNSSGEQVSYAIFLSKIIIASNYISILILEYSEVNINLILS